MAAKKQDLLLFFDRPNEPIFIPKGEEKKQFQVPNNYLPEKYQQLDGLGNRFGEDVGAIIPVRNISLPDISLPLQLEKRDQFSLFVPKHRKMAGKLIDIFMGMRNVDDLQSMAAYCQSRVNAYMFNYCLSVALLHRPDTQGLDLPTFAETFPDKFVDPLIFNQAREAVTTVTSGEKTPLIVPREYTASGRETEQTLAYFREDLGVNLHHWHWHLVYPFDATDRAVVDKDRRGELFYYMHQQIIARYNTERMCNNLGRVTRFNNFREPIREGYFPKLDSTVASRSWPPRFENSVLRDLDRPLDEVKVDISQLETWIERFITACEQQTIQLPNGRQVPLTEENGIDILGNLMESSVISRNRGYYGDLHNVGHLFISYVHDPDHRHLEPFGVMGDSATAMRDPIFYRWHAYIDDLFLIYKSRLPKYTTEKLSFPGVTVANINIEGGNTINTMWQQSDMDLSRGMDFVPRSTIYARFTHLQHRDYNYVIQAENSSGQNLMGTVRIFMAPRNDERGQPLTFEEQRRLMIELDKFTTSLRPGSNTIKRPSTESAVTIPFERTFRNLDQNRPEAGTDAAAEFDFCGCGWPQHMLIPKGTAQGFPVDLFCMISNWTDDRIDQDLVGSCNDAASYCGIRNRRYPDRQSMGYPFDRVGRDGINSLRDFLTPNMAIQQCNIRFSDQIVMRQQQ